MVKVAREKSKKNPRVHPLLQMEEPWSPTIRTKVVDAIRTSESDALAVALLHRLLITEPSQYELHIGNPGNKIDLYSRLVHDLIHRWWQGSISCRVKPSDFLEEIEHYRKLGGIIITLPIYVSILQVAVRQYHQSSAALGKRILSILQDSNMTPNSEFYSALFAATGSLEYLKLAVDTGPSTTSEVFTEAITTIAPKAANRAHDLLKLMLAYPDAKPCHQAFVAVILGYLQSDNPAGCHRAQNVLEDMEPHGLKSNTRLYTIVMEGFAKRGKAVRAHELFKNLVRMYERTNDSNYLPTTTCFSIVIDACVKNAAHNDERTHALYNTALRADAVLEYMHAMAQSIPSVRPNKESYAGVIQAWANTRHTQAPERAEALLDCLESLYETTGNSDVKPTKHAMLTVIGAWIKLRPNDVNGAARAEALLNRMCKLYEQGDSAMKPTKKAFMDVMDAYATSYPHTNKKKPEVNVVEKVNALHAKMKELCYPNSAIPLGSPYATAISACGRHELPNICKEKAEALFEEFKKEGIESPDMPWEAKQQVYNALLDVYRILKQPHEAQALLEQMESPDDGVPLVDMISFNTTLRALSNSSKHDDCIRAKELFARMKQTRQFRPDAVSYSNVITAISHQVPHDATFLEQVSAYFEELKAAYRAGDSRCKPNQMIYPHILKAISKSRTMTADLADQALVLLDEMHQFDLITDSRIFALALDCQRRVSNRAFASYLLLQQMEKQKIPIVDSVHCNSVLQACAWNRGPKHVEKEIREIAKNVYEKMNHKTPETFGYMIFLFSNDPYVEKLYEECQRRQLHMDRRVTFVVEKHAPFLLSPHVPNNRMSQNDAGCTNAIRDTYEASNITATRDRGSDETQIPSTSMPVMDVIIEVPSEVMFEPLIEDDHADVFGISSFEDHPDAFLDVNIPGKSMV